MHVNREIMLLYWKINQNFLIAILKIVAKIYLVRNKYTIKETIYVFIVCFYKTFLTF